MGVVILSNINTDCCIFIGIASVILLSVILPIVMAPSLNVKHLSIQRNGRESALYRALDGSTYPGQKLVSSCHRKKNILLLRNATPYTCDW